MLKVNQSISASPYPSPLADGAFKANLKVDQRLDLSQQPNVRLRPMLGQRRRLGRCLMFTGLTYVALCTGK